MAAIKNDDRKLSLDNIGGGVALDLFNEKLQEVMENILDPSTEEKAVREITIKFKFKPNGERTVNKVAVLGSVKLGPTKAYDTKAFIGQNAEGTFEAYEHNPSQMTMAFDQFIKQPKLAAKTATVVDKKEASKC